MSEMIPQLPYIFLVFSHLLLMSVLKGKLYVRYSYIN